MKSQKDAVVSQVKAMLSTFVPYKDIALVMLSKHELERLKTYIGTEIMAGNIEYSKSLNRAEVMAYARSMVMNHLKKARELNGNQTYGAPGAIAKTASKALAGIDLDVLTPELRELVETL